MENNIVKCEICGKEMKARINGSHLLRAHRITLNEYKQKFPYAIIGKRTLKIITYTCRICNKIVHGSPNLSRHLNQCHKVRLKDYYVKYYLNDQCPICKCGCNQTVNFNNMESGFDKYIIRHAPAWNDGLNRNVDDRVNHMYDNRRVWNKGLSKLTDLTVNAVAVKIQQSWNSTNLAQRSASYKETMMKKYGVVNGFQLENVKTKSKQTCLKKYGVESPQFSNKIKFRWKDYTLPSGKIIKYQGYEKFGMDFLLQKYNEQDIITDRKIIPKIKYTDFNGTLRTYCPDMWIPKDNLIVEIKSDYTYKLHEKNILYKQKGVISSGYKFNLFVFKRKQLIKTINE